MLASGVMGAALVLFGFLVVGLFVLLTGVLIWEAWEEWNERKKTP